MDDTKHWLCRLRLVDPGKLTAGFAPSELETMARHRNYIADLTAAGTCILAGRTNTGEQTFGLVIFRAADEQSARSLMEGDPAIADGLMQAELFPFMLAFLAQNDRAIL